MNKETNTIIKMLKTTGIFFIGTVLSKLMLFFLLPIYTKYIPTADFGYYDLSITYVAIVTSVLFFDIWVSIMRHMYDKADIKWKKKAILSGGTIFVVSSIIYIALTVVLGVIADIQYLLLISLYGLSLNINHMYTFPARGFGKNIEFAVSGIINTLVTIIVNIILIVGLTWDFSSLYIASIIGNLAQTLYLEYKLSLFRNLHWRDYDSTLTKQILIYTLPLCINSVAYWLLTGYNRLVINEIMSTSANGIYAIGNKFAVAIALVASCFTLAWQDVSFSRGIDTGEFYSKASRLYLIFMGVGTILLIPMFNVLFPFIVNEAYWLAKGTIPLFLLTTAVSTYSTFIGNIFYAIKDTKTIFSSMVASCALNLILCHTFIRLWGLNGANLSIMISFILNILIRYFILKKKINFSFDVKSTAVLIAGICASMFVYENYTIMVNMAWLVASGVGVLLIFRKDVSMIYKSVVGK